MPYSVNVDRETPNDDHTQGRICHDHPGIGDHYDITIHPPGCPHHQICHRVNQPPIRFWRDFDDEQQAVEWAESQAKEAANPPVRVRWCHQSGA